MKHLIDLATWNRREHFAFFSAFEEPFFGLVATVDRTRALAEAKRLGVPFFLYDLHAALQAVNQVEALRYRIKEGQVCCYDHHDLADGYHVGQFLAAFQEQLG